VEEQRKPIIVTPFPQFALRIPSRPLAAAGLRWRAVLFGVILAGYATSSSLASAQQSKPEEYHVKAVYLYNFGKFIQWPDTVAKDKSFPICVLGQDPFGVVLDATITGEKIDNRQLLPRRISSTRDAAGCRILFISSSEAPRIKDILAAVDKFSAVTVSDIPDFTAAGGMIQFVTRENKVRFEVNLTAVEKAGLTFSSQLLKVATDIRKAPGDEGVKP
jgi:hypothetical protein